MSGFEFLFGGLRDRASRFVLFFFFGGGGGGGEVRPGTQRSEGKVAVDAGFSRGLCPCVPATTR